MRLFCGSITNAAVLTNGSFSYYKVAGYSKPVGIPYCVSMEGSGDCMLYALCFSYDCFSLVPLVNGLHS